MSAQKTPETFSIENYTAEALAAEIDLLHKDYHTGVIWAQASAKTATAANDDWLYMPGGGAIGQNGQMPWHLPQDLKWFARITRGKTVIMGANTWRSLPERFRPLPGRRNIVVSRRSGQEEFSGAEQYDSIERALQAVAGEPHWIIGGGQIYDACLEKAQLAVITQINMYVPDADTHAPELLRSWQQTGLSSKVIDGQTQLAFSLWQQMNQE